MMKQPATIHSGITFLIATAFISVHLQGSHPQVEPTDAAVQSLATGTIIEKVLCTADVGRSYALYLPSDYTPDRTWPIIYAFDPAARGALPVELYQEAAEKYGFIIAGSNNSRNGPWKNNMDAAAAMIMDTQSRFSMDPHRRYTTGFSGGARVACETAYQPQYQVAGVIAHGAGFRQGHGPEQGTPFIFFGTVGNMDFNLMELKALEHTLDELGIPNRLAIFDGPHDWGPKHLCTEAVEWMDIRAVAAGIRERDDKYLEELYQKRLNTARESEAGGQLYDAYVTYTYLASDFKELRDVQEIEEKAAQLKGLKTVKNHLRLTLKLQEKEEEELGVIGTHFAALAYPTKKAEATSTLTSMAKRYNKQTHLESKPGQSRMAVRILNYMDALASTDGTQYLEKKYYPEAVAVLELWTTIRPDYPAPFFYLAGAYAMSNQKDKALSTLATAIEKGLDDAGILERSPYLEPIRRDKAYQQILEELGGRK